MVQIHTSKDQGLVCGTNVFLVHSPFKCTLLYSPAPVHGPAPPFPIIPHCCWPVVSVCGAECAQSAGGAESREKGMGPWLRGALCRFQGGQREEDRPAPRL